MQPFSTGFYRGADGKLAHCSLMLHCSSIYVPAFTSCLISHLDQVPPSSTGICLSSTGICTGFHWDFSRASVFLDNFHHFYHFIPLCTHRTQQSYTVA